MTVEERLKKHLNQTPKVPKSAYIADSAELIGDVALGEDASIWPKCVLRGDINSIKIGNGTNIQDGTIIHLADEHGVTIGDYVTVGHAALLHACIVEDECLIGMKSVVMDGAVIGKRSIVAAGALVPKGMEVPPGSLVVGMPAKVVRTLSEEEQSGLRSWAEKYVKVANGHKMRR